MSDGNINRRNVNQIATAERQRQALELRRAGVNYETIAQQLGYKHPSGAYAAVRAAIKATLKEPAEAVRKLETDRLDRLMLAIWQKAVNGDTLAIDRVLKIMKRRAELEGLDAPVKVAPTTPDGQRPVPLYWKIVVVGEQPKQVELINGQAAH